MHFDYFDIVAYSLTFVILLNGLILRKLKKVSIFMIISLVLLPLIAIDFKKYFINGNHSFSRLLLLILTLMAIIFLFSVYYIAKKRAKEGTSNEFNKITDYLYKLEKNYKKSLKINPLIDRITVLINLLIADIFLIVGYYLGFIPGQKAFIAYLLISLGFFIPTLIIVWQIFRILVENRKKKELP